MLSLDICQNILKKHDFRIEQNDLRDLREYLYQMAELQIANENNYINTNGYECDTLYASFDR